MSVQFGDGGRLLSLYYNQGGTAIKGLGNTVLEKACKPHLQLCLIRIPLRHIEGFTYAPEDFTNVPEDFTNAPEDFTKVPNYLLVIP